VSKCKGLSIYTLNAIHADGREEQVLSALLFEIDKLTQQHQNVNELIFSLIKTGKVENNEDIKDFKIRYKKIKETEILFKDDIKIPISTQSISVYYRNRPKGAFKLFSLLVAPYHLLKYKRYKVYRDLYLFVKRQPEPPVTPKDDGNQLVKKSYY